MATRVGKVLPVSVRYVAVHQAREAVNTLVRGPRWRRAARRALASGQAEEVGPAVASALRVWVAGRRDDRLDDVVRRVERARRAMLMSDEPLNHARTTVAEMTCEASNPRLIGELLYWLTRESGAHEAVELGTCMGFSAAYIASGLPAGGRLLTLDRVDDFVRRAKRLLAETGVADRVDARRADFRSIDLRSATERGFDLAYKDGAHNAEASLQFLRACPAWCRPGAIVLMDDLDHGDGMDTAWAEGTAAPVYAGALSLGRTGIARLAA
jgi:predicted O-methyltransferase YrrM